MNEGCGRFKWKVTSLSPLTVTSSRFWYQALRGLRRNFSFALPSRVSQVHFTSLTVNGLPSCHLTPSRSRKRSSVLDESHDHSLPRSGTIEAKLACATC